jgi:TPR repeat protein
MNRLARRPLVFCSTATLLLIAPFAVLRVRADAPTTAPADGVARVVEGFRDWFYRGKPYPDEASRKLLAAEAVKPTATADVLFWHSRAVVHDAHFKLSDEQKAEVIRLGQRAADGGLDIAIANEASRVMTDRNVDKATWQEASLRLAETLSRREPEAARILGILYRSGAGGLQKDLAKSENMLRIAVTLGHVLAWRELAATLKEQGKYGRAIDALTRGAKDGDERAQLLLGRTLRASGTLFADPAAAEHWFREAAARDLPEAKYELAALLASDGKRQKDYPEALRLLQDCAADVPDAKYTLARAHLYGALGLAADTAKAKQMLRELAETGHADACYEIGSALLTGTWLSKDEAEGMKYLVQAAAKGHGEAQSVLRLRAQRDARDAERTN